MPGSGHRTTQQQTLYKIVFLLIKPSQIIIHSKCASLTKLCHCGLWAMVHKIIPITIHSKSPRTQQCQQKCTRRGSNQNSAVVTYRCNDHCLVSQDLEFEHLYKRINAQIPTGRCVKLVAHQAEGKSFC